jgi:hypothetical protein
MNSIYNLRFTSIINNVCINYLPTNSGFNSISDMIFILNLLNS